VPSYLPLPNPLSRPPSLLLLPPLSSTHTYPPTPPISYLPPTPLAPPTPPSFPRPTTAACLPHSLPIQSPTCLTYSKFVPSPTHTPHPLPLPPHSSHFLPLTSRLPPRLTSVSLSPYTPRPSSYFHALLVIFPLSSNTTPSHRPLFTPFPHHTLIKPPSIWLHHLPSFYSLCPSPISHLHPSAFLPPQPFSTLNSFASPTLAPFSLTSVHPLPRCPSTSPPLSPQYPYLILLCLAITTPLSLPILGLPTLSLWAPWYTGRSTGCKFK